jgi:hypothetical protein
VINLCVHDVTEREKRILTEGSKGKKRRGSEFELGADGGFHILERLAPQTRAIVE